VLDIIKKISLSPRWSIPIISPSPIIFLITQCYTNGKRSRQKVTTGIIPAAITPDIYIFFNPHDYVGQPKGSQTKVNMYVIISEQLAPAHSCTRCHLELHVHHCLGEPHHLLFPRLRGFLLLLATWRSRMVCLSLSAVIPGLELPKTFHERASPLTKHSAPFWALLFSSLLKSRSMFSSSIN
jgi:hypothetical protein